MPTLAKRVALSPHSTVATYGTCTSLFFSSLLLPFVSGPTSSKIMRTSSAFLPAFLPELGVASHATTFARKCSPNIHHVTNVVVDVEPPEAVPVNLPNPLFASAE